MSDLIGYKEYAKNLAVHVEDHLTGTKYWGFRIQGARRSGRSSFFTEVSEHLNVNETVPANCFVGELVHATPEGFEQTLLESINTSNSCSHDYSSHLGKVQESEGFFVLCSDLYEKEGKIPVFLIDMGEAMEEQYSKRGLDGVKDLSRLLRKIYNLLEERNISLILGIGLTTKFVRDSEKFIADVFHRYGAFVTLTNTFFEGEAPCVDFQQIVKTISGLEIPDRYQGLWRGDTVTAGQLGENLKVSGTSEITSQSLWQNLRGEWDILGNIQLETIPPKELGELILADETITDNLYPEYLESCDGGYRANDRLYKTFNFYSPWRDPSTTERIKRRVDDPDDNKVVGEILSSIGKSMDQLGLGEIHEPDVLGQKSGLMEVKVNEHANPDLNALEKELFQTAFPRKLITVLCLTANPAEEVLQERLKKYAEKDCFILILCREGVVNFFGRIPLGRYVHNNIGSARIETVSLEEITSFLSDRDEVLLNEVKSWVIGAISDLFSNKPVLCVGHQTIKQLISGTISTGELPIGSFAQQIGISMADATKCLKFLVQPQILTKRQGIAIWEPHNDVILRILLEYSGNEDKICVEIKNLYTTDNVNIEDLASLYQCISGGNNLVGLTKDKILDHARVEQDHQLDVIGNYLEGERKLNPLYSLKYEEYRNRQLSEIEDITPYRTDIIKLLEDIKSTIDEIKGNRDKNRQELSEKIDAFRQKLENHSKYLSDEQKNELQHKIEVIRSSNSPAFIRVEREIHKQKDRVESLEKRKEKLTVRLDQLQEYSDKTEYKESKGGLEQIEDLVQQFSLDDAEDQIKDADAQIIKLEELKERQDILGCSPVRFEPPDLDGSEKPPDLDGSEKPPDLDGSEKPETPSTGDLQKVKKFDLSNFEERKDLAKTLLMHKEKINKIDVQVGL